MRRCNYIVIVISIILIILSGSVYSIDKSYLRWRNQKPQIDSISINGNQAFTKSEIKDRMYSREYSWWRDNIKNERSIRLQRESIGRDTLEIKYLYYTNGYLNVQVREEIVPLVSYDSASAMVWVNISEGQQFLFGKKTVNGDYTSEFYTNLYKIAQKLKEGVPANPLEIKMAEFEMKTYLANNGYPYAKISSTVDTTSNPPYTDIAFTLNTDSLVRFGEVRIEGDKYYPDAVAMRELKVKEGEIYKRKEIIESQKRLYESGYYSFAQLSPANGASNRLNPDFTLKLRERKPYFTSVKAGAGQSEFKDLIWDLSFSLGKRNISFLPKWAHRVNLEADYSFVFGSDARLFTHLYTLNYTMPWFLGIRMPVTLSGEWEPPLKFEAQDFKIRRWAFAVSTRKYFGKEFRVNVGLEYENIKITDVNVEDIDLIKKEEGISVRRKVYTSFRYDSRNNIFIPQRGALADFSAEYFGGLLGGDDNFYRFKASWSTYQIVWPGWTYAIRMKGGYTRQFGESGSVPSEERLYLGGANTVRSFVENSLGPTLDDGSPRGANITLVFNQEFRWKTIQILNFMPFFGKVFETLPQWQSIFLDIGNGYIHESDIKWDNLAFAYGTGFQIVSPAGPIRIDYSRRIATERFDVASRWHFTILYAF